MPRKRARASRGDRTTAGTFPDPVLTYQVENARFPGSSAILGLDRETSIFATLPLEPIVQRRSRVGRADAEVRAADADFVADTRRVALDAARAWYRAALAQLSLVGALEWRDGLQQLVEYNRPRVAEGVTAEGDLIRVQVERDRAATTATLERVELLRARAELAAFLGRSSAAVAGESLHVSCRLTASTAVSVSASAAIANTPPSAEGLNTARDAANSSSIRATPWS
ncbi:MAG TPA: TolC family protein [Gemmatimonadaceae bacterium]